MIFWEALNVGLANFTFQFYGQAMIRIALTNLNQLEVSLLNHSVKSVEYSLDNGINEICDGSQFCIEDVYYIELIIFEGSLKFFIIR